MEGQTRSKNTNLGFFSYVFNFDDNNKNLLLNLFQYSFLAIPLCNSYSKISELLYTRRG